MKWRLLQGCDINGLIMIPQCFVKSKGHKSDLAIVAEPVPSLNRQPTLYLDQIERELTQSICVWCQLAQTCSCPLGHQWNRRKHCFSWTTRSKSLPKLGCEPMRVIMRGIARCRRVEKLHLSTEHNCDRKLSTDCGKIVRSYTLGYCQPQKRRPGEQEGMWQAHRELVAEFWCSCWKTCSRLKDLIAL